MRQFPKCIGGAVTAIVRTYTIYRNDKAHQAYEEFINDLGGNIETEKIDVPTSLLELGTGSLDTLKTGEEIITFLRNLTNERRIKISR